MARRDGHGPMTGRGVGLCCVVDASANSTIGKGCRRGLGCIDNQGYGYGSIGIKGLCQGEDTQPQKSFY